MEWMDGWNFKGDIMGFMGGTAFTTPSHLHSRDTNTLWTDHIHYS
jgi:hypothetical protein